MLRLFAFAWILFFLSWGVLGWAYSAASLWLLYATSRKRVKAYEPRNLYRWCSAVGIVNASLLTLLSLDFGGIHGIEWMFLILGLIGTVVIWLGQRSGIRWAESAA